LSDADLLVFTVIFLLPAAELGALGRRPSSWGTIRAPSIAVGGIAILEVVLAILLRFV
jgi:hypothetical protein